MDTSVWIANLRGHDTAPVRTLRSYADRRNEVIVGDIVLLEVLRGARDKQHASRMERDLRYFVIKRMLSPELAVEASSNYRLLRGCGVTVRKTADLIIGTYCLKHGPGLLHNDRDFDGMAAHLGLRVIQHTH